MTQLTSLEGMVLVVGNARSGSTVLGAALDSHPQMVIANESSASKTLWRKLDGNAILQDILRNAEVNASKGRPSADYHYQVGLPPSQKPGIRIVGDKIWNPSTLLLHGNHQLIPSLEERLGVPVRIIHAIRNPLDTIATMHNRSGAPVSNRIRWYFMHCDATEAMRERLPATHYLDSYHEDLLSDPGQEIGRLCRFLDVPEQADHIAAVREKLFTSPRQTRDSITWAQADLAALQAGLARFPFLARYAASIDRASGEDNPTTQPPTAG
jgi:hypothetical protein